MATAQEMGYQTNRAAHALVTGRTNLVACWIPSIKRSFYANLTHHLCSEAYRRGFEVVIRLRGLPEDASPKGSSRWPVDGILVCDFLNTAEAFEKEVGTTPAVGLGAYHAESAPYVGVDLYAGTVAAIRHLIEQGCERIAYAVPEYAILPEDARNAAYIATLADAGKSPFYIPLPDHETEPAHRAFSNFWDNNPGSPPDGVFCRNDNVALGIYHALRQRGVRVPGDVAIVGCDGMESTDFLETPLSTIRQPVEEISRVGWDMLEQRMRGGILSDSRVLLLPQLTIRASSLRNH